MPRRAVEAVGQGELASVVLLSGRSVVLVGEAPSRRSDPRRPLDGPCGSRLERLAEIPVGSLGDRCVAVNLLPAWPGRRGKGAAFPMAEARAAAAELVPLLEGRAVLLLGRRVAAAFGVVDWPYLVPMRWEGGPVAAVVPHPSGVCRWWNDPEASRRAAGTLRLALGTRRGLVQGPI